MQLCSLVSCPQLTTFLLSDEPTPLPGRLMLLCLHLLSTPPGAWFPSQLSPLEVYDVGRSVTHAGRVAIFISYQ